MSATKTQAKTQAKIQAKKQVPATFAFGRLGELHIENWLRRACRYNILSVYEGGRANKGPRLWMANDTELVLPDILAMRDKDTRWIEAKHKSRFSWYRKRGYWTTGIDIFYYDQYQKVAQKTQWPVYLLFLHKQEMSDGRRCPTGLFAGEINHLLKNESHRFNGYGKGGMVYWRDSTLKRIATIREVMTAQQQKKAA